MNSIMNLDRNLGDGEMAQRVKVLADIHGDLSLIPGTFIIEGESQLPQVVLCMCVCVCTCALRQINVTILFNSSRIPAHVLVPAKIYVSGKEPKESLQGRGACQRRRKMGCLRCGVV